MKERPSSAEFSQHRASIVVPVEIRRQLRLRRITAGLSVKDLAGLSGRSISTIKDLEDVRCTKQRFHTHVVGAVAKALGTTLAELFQTKPPEAPAARDFSTVREMVKTLDAGLIPVIHQLQPRARNTEEAYMDLLTVRLQKQNTKLEDFSRMVHEPSQWTSLLRTLPPADIRIQLDDELRWLQLSFAKQTRKIRNPLLLWDCNCDIPGFEGLRCKIHSHTSGREITSRLHGGEVDIEFLGGTFRWKAMRALWPPSMDSLRLVHELRKSGINKKPYQTVLDLGSGTGFLGISFALMCPSILHVALSDWLLTPMLYGQLNWNRNRTGKEHANVKSFLGLFSDHLNAEMPYDVCLCNPPYLPVVPGFEEVSTQSVVSGTELLQYVIANHARIAREVFVQFSDLAKSDATRAAKAADVFLEPIGAGHWLPFRVGLAEKDAGYLKALELLGLKRQLRDGFPFWHRIQLYRLQSRTKP